MGATTPLMAVGLPGRYRRKLREVWRRNVLRRLPPPIVQAVRAESLSYLEDAALEDLFDAVVALEAARQPGVLIEVGCALGGSAIVIAKAKSRARPFYVFDVFGMPPAPTANDGPDVQARYGVISSRRSPGIDGNPYYGYVEDLLGSVSAAFRRHGIDRDAEHVDLVPGMIKDTLCGSEPVALAHIDCDRYESVMTCLERVTPRLAPGGRLVIDDYGAWSGCRKAVDTYFQGRRGYRFVLKSRLHIVRA
jgi:predicted O-methyltransferase YrrM